MCTLGAMLLSKRACEEVAYLLNEDDFYIPAHQHVYRAINNLLDNDQAVDLVTVKNELASRGILQQAGGEAYLIQIAESVPSAVNGPYYANIVLERATVRRLSEAGHQIVKIAGDPELEADEKVDEASQVIYDIGRERLGAQFTHIKEVAKKFFIEVDELNDSKEPILGVPTGFPDLDNMTGGFYEGEMTILAARPSMGKTSLGLSFALSAAKENNGAVAIFSLEMNDKQLVKRMASMLSRVSMGVLKKPELHNEDYLRLADACELMYHLPIFIDDTSNVSPLEVRGKCRRLKQEHGLRLVVVDYLQLMSSNRRTENRVQEISEIARGLKAVAKDLEVPVIALAQLSRAVEGRPNKRPILSDIRESGSIEAEADLVAFIYRDEYYKDKEAQTESSYFNPNHTEVAEVILAKHRNGPTGKVLLGFQANYASFVSLDAQSKTDYLRRKNEE